MPRPSRKAKEAAAEGIHNASAGTTILAGNIADFDSSELQQMTDPASEINPGDDSDVDQDFQPPKSVVKRRGRPKGSINTPGSAGPKRPRKTPLTTPAGGAGKNLSYVQSTLTGGGAGGGVSMVIRRGSQAGSTASSVISGGGGAAAGAEDDQEASLFQIVKSGRTALNSVIDDWIESYKLNRDVALRDLIQFFIHCSGCKGRVTTHMYHNMEHVAIIRKMTEEFDEESGDYPLIISGPVWKKFKTNFCEFIQVLVKHCQYSIIYDQYMMDNVISLLTGLTDSQVRAFRHTSTLAAMKLMSALVDVALNLSINLDHTQRQYDSERQKNRNKQASERLEMLLQKRQEIEENQEEIRNMLTYIFKGVFVHRYRDTQPEIRTICMQEIGVWMKRYPAMFLDDSYLKYVGWTLYDRTGEVRQTCLRCLQPLYDTAELAPKLELFTNRFKDRIVEMTLDKEYDVAVAGVKLVIAILRCSDKGPDLLSDKDCENVYELVYSSHRGVAQAAGDFLNSKLFSQELDEETRNIVTKKGKTRSENTTRIRDLVQFFIESELHEHGAYLVDSLWEINDMLKDWECMTDLLLEEPGKGEEAMDDRQETSLIEIMVCCVKQAATGEYPVGRGPTRKLTSRESRQVADDKEKLTGHFIVALPQLLAKYNVDAEKVSNLLQIPLYFDLEIYTSGRQEKNLEALLMHIGDVVEKHTDSEVLENCSKALEAFCNDNYAISSKCQIAKSSLIDSLVQKYMQAYTEFFEGRTDPDEDDAYALMASLKRIYAFYCCHDVNKWNLYSSLFHIVQSAGEFVPEEIQCKALACCSMAITWYLQAINKDNPDKTAMKELKKRLAIFLNNCENILGQPGLEKLQEDAYITICDQLIIFGRHLATNHAVLEPLVYEPEKNLQNLLISFLGEKVFIEDDDDDMDENQKIEELHKRRNFLACFCKLIVYNVLHITCAADMFKFYMRYYNDYGDIIKATLGKSREINKIATSRTLALSLTQLFNELQSEQGGTIDRTSEGFQAIKELARRFNLSFGLDQIKNREAVAAMHKEGILFALPGNHQEITTDGPPPNLAFLEVLAEFTSKLLRQDKRSVLQYLDKQLQSGLPGQDEAWLPLLTYRNSLIQGESDMPMKPPSTTGRGRGRGKRKQTMEASSTENTFMSSETPRGRGGPPAHSTAVKRRRGGGSGGAAVPRPASDYGAEQESLGGGGGAPSDQGEGSSERDFEDDRPPDRPRITLRIRSQQVPNTQASWLQSQKVRNRRKTETSYSKSTRGGEQELTPQQQKAGKNKSNATTRSRKPTTPKMSSTLEFVSSATTTPKESSQQTDLFMTPRPMIQKSKSKKSNKKQEKPVSGKKRGGKKSDGGLDTTPGKKLRRSPRVSEFSMDDTTEISTGKKGKFSMDDTAEISAGKKGKGRKKRLDTPPSALPNLNMDDSAEISVGKNRKGRRKRLDTPPPALANLTSTAKRTKTSGGKDKKNTPFNSILNETISRLSAIGARSMAINEVDEDNQGFVDDGEDEIDEIGSIEEFQSPERKIMSSNAIGDVDDDDDGYGESNDFVEDLSVYGESQNGDNQYDEEEDDDDDDDDDDTIEDQGDDDIEDEDSDENIKEQDKSIEEQDKSIEEQDESIEEQDENNNDQVDDNIDEDKDESEEGDDDIDEDQGGNNNDEQADDPENDDEVDTLQEEVQTIQISDSQRSRVSNSQPSRVSSSQKLNSSDPSRISNSQPSRVPSSQRSKLASSDPSRISNSQQSRSGSSPRSRVSDSQLSHVSNTQMSAGVPSSQLTGISRLTATTNATPYVAGISSVRTTPFRNDMTDSQFSETIPESQFEDEEDFGMRLTGENCSQLTRTSVRSSPRSSTSKTGGPNKSSRNTPRSSTGNTSKPNTPYVSDFQEDDQDFEKDEEEEVEERQTRTSNRNTPKSSASRNTQRSSARKVSKPNTPFVSDFQESDNNTDENEGEDIQMDEDFEEKPQNELDKENPPKKHPKVSQAAEGFYGNTMDQNKNKSGNNKKNPTKSSISIANVDQRNFKQKDDNVFVTPTTLPPKRGRNKMAAKKALVTASDAKGGKVTSSRSKAMEGLFNENSPEIDENSPEGSDSDLIPMSMEL